MLSVRILTRTGEVYSGNADSAVLPAKSGAMEVLPRHIPFITVIDTGLIVVKRDGAAREFTVSSGIAFLINDELTVFSDASESAEQIDLDRARAAQKKALADIEEHRGRDPLLHRLARDHLRRAENRLKLAQKRGGGRKA